MKIKVMLVIPDLMGLGVQHDVRCLMQNWNKETFEVVLLLHSRTGDFADQFTEDMKSIHVDDYTYLIPGLSFLTRLIGYKRAIQDFMPHVVISFVPYCNYATAFAKIVGSWKFKLVMSEHAHVSAAMKDHQNSSNIFMRIYRHTFTWVYNKYADIIKCIAKESLDDLIENHGIKPDKLVLIHNPVPFQEVAEMSKESINDFPFFSNSIDMGLPLLINVGRLVNQKRQDLLIYAFSLVRKKLPCNLVIVGSGPDEQNLRDLVTKLNLDDSVLFAGFQKNPWRFIAKADCFVLTSLWEGLPCVITETMVLGIPIVSVPCPSGPREMLLNGEAGFLCDGSDAEEIATKILEALTNKKLASAKVRIATNNLDRFSPESVTKQYEDLVMGLVCR